MVKRKFLGEMLIDAGFITTEQLGLAMEQMKGSGLRIGEALVRMGFATQETIIEAIGDQAGIPYVNLDDYIIDQKVLGLIPENLARSYLLFPIFKISNTLTVAMADPLNVKAIDEARRKAGCEIDAAVSTTEQITRAIDHYYGVSGSIDDIVKEIEEDAQGITVESEEAPIIRIINLVILQAIRDNASDIHIEPDDKKLGIRYRVDSLLREAISPPKHLQAAILSRIKVMADMDIAETRAPQDGRFQMNLEEREVECRVSSFPTIYGENIVIRILDQSKTILKLDDLGLPPKMLEKYYAVLRSPYGIILVTGPTGSGKTTTLYASLNTINSVEKNIITIEDPVEYRLQHIRQTQINPKAGVTFAGGMRSILRQDPDVIMVGEMRDLETSEIAFQAALTGHLVFSTLHTNDAAGALARLLHLGIEPFLVASSTICVIAQRLVRTICPNCKTKHTPSKEMLTKYTLKDEAKPAFHKGKGCKTCHYSGYKGRTGIFEVMVVDENLKELILRNASTSEIRQAAKRSQAMTLLREEGLAKAAQGLTTLEEVTRLTFEDK